MTAPIYQVGDGAVLAFLPAPMPCRCGRAAMIFVNRLGVSRCIRCDEEAGR